MKSLRNSLAFLSIVCIACASSPGAPPKSALVIAFENEYELSLLANTLSDQGIDTALIVPSTTTDLYDHLIEDVRVHKLRVNGKKSARREVDALEACESFLRDDEVSNVVRELQPTFVIFPAIRHDGCLLPWVKSIKSIPVIWALSHEDELYTFHQTGVALSIQTGGVWTRLMKLLNLRSLLSNAESNYAIPALLLVAKYLPQVEVDLENLYQDVDLVFWGADPVLRSNFVSFTQLFVEIGCHHCRGFNPLPPALQKELIEYRLGTIAVLLDGVHAKLIRELALNLPQGRQGQAVVWKNSNVTFAEEKPENLFVRGDVVRQDIIGFGRTRVLLSHCADTELLEAAFHGTPTICFPRNEQETSNELRAVELGFAYSTNGDFGVEAITSAVKRVHETAGYRENARKVSVAIRDRPNPVTDRIFYWLDYVARNVDKDERLLAVRNHSKFNYRRMFNEDLWFLVGLSTGITLGSFLPLAYFLARRILAANRLSTGRPSKPKRR